MLTQAIMMTGSDLCSSSKCWDAQYGTTSIIYQEFYEQVKPNFRNRIIFCQLRTYTATLGKNQPLASMNGP